jgi:NADPH2:quinone reductase
MPRRHQNQEISMLSIRVAPNNTVSTDDVLLPSPLPDQAVVRVHASTINRGELALIEAREPGWGPGQDVAGVVAEAAPDGSGPPVGTRVVGLAEQGAWSDDVAVTASRLATVPESVDLTAAATLPMAGLTALRTVRQLGSIVGRHVLITGAAGGVGRFQVQLAQLSGATVTALTRTPDTIADARMITDIQHAEPADAALDSVGGPALAGVLAALRPRGVLVLLGASSGRRTPLSIYDFVGHEGVSVHTYFSYTADPHDDRTDLEFLLSLLSNGRLTTDITATWPLHQTSRALSHFASHSTRGKIVLTNNVAEKRGRTGVAQDGS